MLCYPSHTTHVYQGLDVVIFSVLKRCWTEERDKVERNTGALVSKKNFLAIYGAAHIRALTPDNIRAAFRKTGVVPFNPNILRAEQMAPSRETSLQANMPLPFSTPVKIITDAFTMLARKRAKENQNSDSDDEVMEDDEPVNIPETLIDTFARLSHSSAHPLFSAEPVTSETHPPAFDSFLMSPVKNHGDLLSMEPQTEREQLLQVALREMEIREAYRKGQLHGQQAAIILQNVYCEKVRRQLATKEEKKKKTGGRKRLVGDGKPRLLTHEDFIKNVADHALAIQQEATEKERRKVARTEHSEALKVWRAEEEARKARNGEADKKFRVELGLWEAERDAMKAKKKKPRWNKPTRKPVERPIPKPKKRKDDSSSSDEASSDDE